MLLKKFKVSKMVEAISEGTASESLPSSYEERSEEDKTCSRVGQEVIQQAKQPSYTQQFLYEVSLSYTKWTSNAWWSKIEPLNLYLGAIPLKNQGHLEQIAELGITDVLSIVEDFELADGWVNSPAKKEDWEALGVQVKQIPAVDFYPLTQQEIQEGIEHLHTLLQEGKTVYVHCKAGRGRSATIVIAYLMKYHGLSFEQAFSTIKEARSAINLNAGQQQAIFDYFSIDLKSPETSELISQEKLQHLLSTLLTHVIHGGSFSAEGTLPDAIATWIPPVEIQSTLQRRNRYLREYQGNQDKAVEASIQRNHGLTRTFKKFAAGAIPII